MANTSKLLWEEIASRAISFAKEWEKAHSEKSHSRDFIRAFLSVFGVKDNVGEFEKSIKLPDGTTNFADFHWSGYISIEMKSKGKKLDDAFEQLKGYMANLPDGEVPPDLWMVSNFDNIHLYHRPTGQFFEFKTERLRKYIKHFAILAGYPFEQIRGDKTEVNQQATAKMNKLFEALQAHNYSGHELEVYLARLLFCLFADDTGIFTQDSFYQYIKNSNEKGSDLSGRLDHLFQDLNDETDKRITNPWLPDKDAQNQFRYVNGGLFSERLRSAAFDKKMRQTLMECLDFDWSKINPAIFGSMFQGVLDRDERRDIGAHYTTEENILKVVNPLFMDALRAEFKQVMKKPNLKTIGAFHDKIANLKFLDPACGCGNFLIIAYRELRLLEHEVVRVELDLESHGHKLLNIATHIRVKIENFYGIEILSWPCQIAMTGMWLMDHLMNLQVSAGFGKYYDRLPLTKGAEIVHGNAHRIDWESIVPKNELNYILGNPPFVGYAYQSDEQKEDVLSVYLDPNGKPYKNAGKIDYVAAWYYHASKYISGTNIKAAFVSTNSITQGEQVTSVWKPLFDLFKIHIDFAYRTFKWSSEAKGKATVHCVIVGFSIGEAGERSIYDGNEKITAKHINPYLVDARNTFIESRRTPIFDVPEMQKGNIPVDGGNLIIEDEDLAVFLKDEPGAKPFIRLLLGSDEYINNRKRWCLWLDGVSPKEWRSLPEVKKRVEACRKFRLDSKKEATRKYAEEPSRFMEIRQPTTDYLAIPEVSSERRRYIPIGYLPASTIVTNKIFTVPNTTLYHFGILTSIVHMAWMRAICGRMKSDYSYSSIMVYNNFPWSEATDKQKVDIGKLAKDVLDAREMYKDNSFADLYDPDAMPRELLRAHRELDKVVLKLYGFAKDTPEAAIVADLMEMYNRLTNKE